jgi:putative ABC transport system permease protein
MLIACGNVAMLALSEANARVHELATRTALGAGRMQLVRLLLTESTLLGLTGSLAGGGLAYLIIHSVIPLVPPSPRVTQVSLDLRTFCFSAAAGLTASLLFGVGPAVMSTRRLSRVGIGSAREGRSKANQGFQRVVAGGQIALTAVLLVSGGLFTRSLIRLLDVDPGFDPDGVQTLTLVPDRGTYAGAAHAQYLARVVEAIEGIPGVERAGASNSLPFSSILNVNSVGRPGREGSLRTSNFYVTPGYLETLRVPLIAGRTFERSDGPAAPRVLVLDREAARRGFPDRSPVGETVVDRQGEITVVGVVGEVKRDALSAGSEPTVYWLSSQAEWDGKVTLVARTSGSLRNISDQMRSAAWSIDPAVPVTRSATLRTLVEESARSDRFRMVLVNVFAALAVLLAAVGTFGVTARTVSMRRMELGVRKVLGALPHLLLWQAVRQGIAPALVGTGLGLLGAYWSGRFVESYLFEIQPADPLVYGAVASLLSARPAVRVDPAQVLRME